MGRIRISENVFSRLLAVAAFLAIPGAGAFQSVEFLSSVSVNEVSSHDTETNPGPGFEAAQTQGAGVLAAQASGAGKRTAQEQGAGKATAAATAVGHKAAKALAQVHSPHRDRVEVAPQLSGSELARQLLQRKDLEGIQPLLQP